MSIGELRKQIENLSAEELAEFREWFSKRCGECMNNDFDYESEVPIHHEVLACLDALWNFRVIRNDYELKALKKAGMTKIGVYLGRLPPRPSMLQARRDFENDFYGAIAQALENLDLLRGGVSLQELDQPTANIVFLGAGEYGVEIFINRDVEPLLVRELEDPHHARRWILKMGNEYAIQHGAPPGTELIIVG